MDSQFDRQQDAEARARETALRKNPAAATAEEQAAWDNLPGHEDPPAMTEKELLLDMYLWVRDTREAVREIRDTVREVRAFADTIPERVDSMPPMLKMMFGNMFK